MPIVPPGRQTRSELVGDRLMIGGEHRAERRRDDVELAVAERQRLGVGLDPLELDASRAASRRPASKFSGVRSEATTSAPASAARIATFPVPAATSSTRWPAPIPQASTSTGPSSQTVCFANRGSRRAPTSPARRPCARRLGSGGRDLAVIVLLSPRSSRAPRLGHESVDRLSMRRPYGAVAAGFARTGHLRRPPSMARIWLAPGVEQPARTAWAAAAVREGRSSLRRMLVTWRWTVCSLTTSRSAICRFVSPSASRPQHLPLARA